MLKITSYSMAAIPCETPKHAPHEPVRDYLGRSKFANSWWGLLKLKDKQKLALGALAPRVHLVGGVGKTKLF
jgi:hypothetical protein